MNIEACFSIHELTMDGKRIVVMVVPAVSKVPTSFDGNRYWIIGSSKVNLNKYPERESNFTCWITDHK